MRGVLFDFGGTLNTNGDHWGALFRERLGAVFPDRTIDELEKAYIASERELVRQGLREETFRETLRLQVWKQFACLGDERRERAEEIADELYDGVARRMSEVRESLRKLAARYRVGVVSNFYGNLDAVCREFELTPYLSLIVDSALVGVRKPDPEIWELAIRTLRMPATDVAVVGDSWKNDIAPTAPLGCRTIWYRGLEWRPASGAENADFQVRSLEELHAILLAPAGG